MIITVDGLDGSGKSTLARNLSAYYDFLFIDKPINVFYSQVISTSKQNIEMMNESVSKVNSSLLNASYSTLPLIYIKEAMNDKNMVINGGLLSSHLQNGNNQTESLYNNLVTNGLLFDLSIFLYCNREERLNRLRKKSSNDTYLLNETLNNVDYEKTYEFIKKYPNNNIIIIDTTNKSIDEVLEIAKEEINRIISEKGIKVLIK